MCNIFFIIHIYHKQCSVKSHLSYEGEKASSVFKKNWACGGCTGLWRGTTAAALPFGGELRRLHSIMEGNHEVALPFGGELRRIHGIMEGTFLWGWAQEVSVAITQNPSSIVLFLFHQNWKNRAGGMSVPGLQSTLGVVGSLLDGVSSKE